MVRRAPGSRDAVRSKGQSVIEHQRRSSYLFLAQQRVSALDANVQKIRIAVIVGARTASSDGTNALDLAVHRAEKCATIVVAALTRLECADVDQWESARGSLEDAWEDVGDAILGVVRRVADAQTINSGANSCYLQTRHRELTGN